MTRQQVQLVRPLDGQRPLKTPISPASKELVLALVVYAGAGCSNITQRLVVCFKGAGFKVHLIKLSTLLQEYATARSLAVVPAMADDGASKLLLSRRYTGHAAWPSQAVSMTCASDVSGISVGD